MSRVLAALLFLGLGGFSASGQQSQIPADLSFSFLQERTKFVGSGTNPYFMMRGAKADFAYSLAGGLGLAVSGTGLSTVNLRGSIDQEQIALLAGPRYTWNWGHITPTASNRKGSLYLEGKVGYVIAIAGQFPVNGLVMDHASALTYLGGAGVNVHIYDRFEWRALEVEYLRNQLPNGGTNVQNSLRLGSGINFHFGL
ncbi:MAG: hypothetical protein INR62_13405 [Rhodospirillales bacterium]|nr:hypothetical protein [Acetobacter sp.]